MSFTYKISEALKLYDGEQYKFIVVNIRNTNSSFRNSALNIDVLIDDGTNQVSSFRTEISGDRKELYAYFPVDAFTGFASSSDIIFGYLPAQVDSISGVDVLSIDSLPPFIASTPHSNATNAWVASL